MSAFAADAAIDDGADVAVGDVRRRPLRSAMVAGYESGSELLRRVDAAVHLQVLDGCFSDVAERGAVFFVEGCGGVPFVKVSL